MPLLGAQTCQELNFIKVMVSDSTCPETVRSVKDHLQTSPRVLSKEWILKEYSDVFEGLGCMDGLCHMEVDETVRPVVHPPRKVSVALTDRLKEELDKLIKESIITTVIEPTKWVSSLVLVNKPEKLRISKDPQDLNKALPRSIIHFQQLKGTRLSKAKVFSVLDAKNGTGRTRHGIIVPYYFQHAPWSLLLAPPSIWCEDRTRRVSGSNS